MKLHGQDLRIKNKKKKTKSIFNKYLMTKKKLLCNVDQFK